MESPADGLDENPFSFKQFLKNQSEPSEPTVVIQSATKIDHVCEDSKNIGKEIPFPDLHQPEDDLLRTKKKGKGKKIIKQTSNKKQELPDPQTDNPFSFKHFVKKDAALKTSGRVLQIIDDEVHEIDYSANVTDVEDPSISLTVQTASETAADKDLEKPSTLQLITTPSKPEDLVLTLQQELYSEITKLKNENKILRKELKEAKQLKENENKRVESLCKKLKEIEQKENEETVALEKMVHMVEKNLELTTQRAIKAEGINAKLREENKILKSNSVSKVVYDDLVNQHHTSLASIKDQATSAAQHLNITAKNAEESLKQLHAGVDSFKLVSQLLSSIDKFSSVHEEPQT